MLRLCGGSRLVVMALLAYTTGLCCCWYDGLAGWLVDCCSQCSSWVSTAATAGPVAGKQHSPAVQAIACINRGMTTIAYPYCSDERRSSPFRSPVPAANVSTHKQQPRAAPLCSCRARTLKKADVHARILLWLLLIRKCAEVTATSRKS